MAGQPIFEGPRPAPALEPPPAIAVQRHAAADPDHLAVADATSGERLTMGELAGRSASLATGLARRGIGRGDLVAVAMPNSVWWPVVTLGVWRTGAAVAAFNPAWTAPETARLLALTNPRIAIAAGSAADSMCRGVSAASVGTELFVSEPDEGMPLPDLMIESGATPSGPQLRPGDLAVVPFSSGTGGMPKAVRLTHANLAVAAAHIASVFGSVGGFDSTSVVLAGAPYCAVMGLGLGLCAPFSAGAQIVTLPVPRTEPVLRALERYPVTHAIVAPRVVTDVAAGASVAPGRLGALEFVGSGGAHVPAAEQVRAGELLGCVVRQGYGMTEAPTISAPRGGPSAPETVGWLGSGTEARVIDPERGRDVAPGDPGELWVRGPQVTDGYLGDPDATAATITDDGWLRTGDLVRMRQDGQLVIEDRLKELIKVNGASVAPAELELVLREHPAVDDAAVVGRPHPTRGESPVAWVVRSGQADAGELIDFVHARVAPHKRLHDVEFVEALPRMPSGKLNRRLIRDHERALSLRSPGS